MKTTILHHYINIVTGTILTIEEINNKIIFTKVEIENEKPKGTKIDFGNVDPLNMTKALHTFKINII